MSIGSSRRKRLFFSRRRDPPTSSRCKKTEGGSRGRKNHLPRDNPTRLSQRLDSHRGVSAPSFRDGAIRFCTCREKQGSHRGRREHRGKIGKGQCSPGKREDMPDLSPAFPGGSQGIIRIARLRELPKSARWLPRD